MAPLRYVPRPYGVPLGLVTILVATGALAGAIITQGPPAPPSVRYLAQWGITVQPLSEWRSGRRVENGSG